MNCEKVKWAMVFWRKGNGNGMRWAKRTWHGAKKTWFGNPKRNFIFYENSEMMKIWMPVVMMRKNAGMVMENAGKRMTTDIKHNDQVTLINEHRNNAKSNYSNNWLTSLHNRHPNYDWTSYRTTISNSDLTNDGKGLMMPSYALTSPAVLRSSLWINNRFNSNLESKRHRQSTTPTETTRPADEAGWRCPPILVYRGDDSTVYILQTSLRVKWADISGMPAIAPVNHCNLWT